MAFEGDQVYCYGNSDGCLWDGGDCETDGDCAKYEVTQARGPKFSDGARETAWKSNGRIAANNTQAPGHPFSLSFSRRLNTSRLGCHERVPFQVTRWTAPRSTTGAPMRAPAAPSRTTVSPQTLTMNSESSKKRKSWIQVRESCPLVIHEPWRLGSVQ